MALYLNASAVFKVGTDSTLAELLASRNLAMTEGTDHEEMTAQFLEIADSVSGQAVAFGPVTTGKALLIIASRQITANLNGSEAVTVGHTAAEAAWMVLPATSLTSLTLDNASGDVAEVHVVILGV